MSVAQKESLLSLCCRVIDTRAQNFYLAARVIVEELAWRRCCGALADASSKKTTCYVGRDTKPRDLGAWGLNELLWHL